MTKMAPSITSEPETVTGIHLIVSGKRRVGPGKFVPETLAFFEDVGNNGYSLLVAGTTRKLDAVKLLGLMAGISNDTLLKFARDADALEEMFKRRQSYRDMVDRIDDGTFKIEEICSYETDTPREVL